VILLSRSEQAVHGHTSRRHSDNKRKKNMVLMQHLCVMRMSMQIAIGCIARETGIKGETSTEREVGNKNQPNVN
jgi:hypothetical protein